MFESSIEDTSADNNTWCASYIAPWNTPDEETTRILPCDYNNAFTTIAPKYDVMGTISEECSPIFNTPVVEAYIERDISISEDMPKSEDTVGSILDYIESDNGRIESSTVNINDNVKGVNFRDNNTDRTEKNIKVINKGTSPSSNYPKNYCSMSPPSEFPSSTSDSGIFNKSAENCEKGIGYLNINNVRIQYRRKWTSFTIGNK